MKTNYTVAWCLLLSLLLPNLTFGQYTLTDDDVVVDENGYIQSCSYEDGGDIIIPEVLDGKTVVGIADKDYPYGVFQLKNLTSVQFPDSLRVIGDWAFIDNEIQGTLILPDSLEEIKRSAFMRNEIVSVQIPTKIKNIPRFAFSENKISGHLNLPPDLRSIEYGAFMKNEITGVELPVSLKQIGPLAFSENKLEGELILSHLDVEIEFDAFRNNNYTKVHFNSTTKVISEGILSTNNLQGELVLPESLEIVKAQALEFNEITSIIFPEATKFIRYRAFSSNRISGQLFLPDSIKGIDYFAFGRNNISQDLVLPKELKELGNEVFRYNANITSVTFPSGLTSLGTGVFDDLSANGYESFGGWYTDTTYQTPIEITLENVKGETIYGKWETIDYTITYEGGFTNHNNPTTYDVETEIDLSTAGDRDGYKVEWYTSAEYDSMVTKIALGSYGDKTLYGKEKAIDYSITFHNGGTHENQLQYTIESDSITFTSAEQLGYVFEGWYSDAELTQEVTGISAGSFGNKDIYANWSLVEYSITYHGAEENYEGITIYTVEDDNIELLDAQQENFTFEGWFTTPDFTAESKIEIIDTSIPQDYDLYAKLKEDDVTSLPDDLESALLVYPNPATTSFQVNRPIKTLILMNSVGVVIKEYRNVTVFDVSTIPNGIYYIRASAQGKSYKQKLVIRK